MSPRDPGLGTPGTRRQQPQWNSPGLIEEDHATHCIVRQLKVISYIFVVIESLLSLDMFIKYTTTKLVSGVGIKTSLLALPSIKHLI